MEVIHSDADTEGLVDDAAMSFMLLMVDQYFEEYQESLADIHTGSCAEEN